MAQGVTLNGIASADASPAQAREVLLAIFGQPTPDVLRDVYLALRAWVWKALDQRRRDPDLRAWNDILGAASSLMAQNGQPSLGERITALHELLSESISVGETLGAVDVTQRQHVAEALDFLAESDGQANRSAIGERLCLGQANLTRVLNLMSAAGLIERTTLGKEAIFALSRAGRAAHQTRAASKRRRLMNKRQIGAKKARSVAPEKMAYRAPT
jgi:DNA-binding MarR family transcriptional regulator